MKKALLLSVVASTMIMAGGDIAPVEPVVETPAAPVETSAWNFNGEAVVYYQTNDAFGTGDLFDQASSAANLGLQLTATNTDLIGGIGAGFQLTGLGTLGLEKDVVSGVMQIGDTSINSGAITQGYLTYGVANTSFKVGRQALPKGLSPFAFSESWNVFQNTFEAGLIVNSDLPNTTLVYAYVWGANNHGSLSSFDDITAIAGVGATAANDGVHMVTAQNKSIDGLTLTGSWYYATDMVLGLDDANILWLDGQFAVAGLNVGLQGGGIFTGEPTGTGVKDTTAFGAKIGGTFGMFDASVAYSSVDDGTVSVENMGTHVKTPLYTQMILNQNHIKTDNDTVVIRAGVAALGGKFGVAYDITTDNSAAGNDYTELDLTYKTKVGENLTLFAAYAYQDVDSQKDGNNFVRIWGRYNF